MALQQKAKTENVPFAKELLMPFVPKRGDEFNFTVVALAQWFTYDKVAAMTGLTRGMVSGIVRRSKIGIKEFERVRMKTRRANKTRKTGSVKRNPVSQTATT